MMWILFTHPSIPETPFQSSYGYEDEFDHGNHAETAIDIQNQSSRLYCKDFRDRSAIMIPLHAPVAIHPWGGCLSSGKQSSGLSELQTGPI